MSEFVTLPLTGSGDSTQKVAVDNAGANGVVQLIKLAVSADGSVTLIDADTDGLFVQSIDRAESPQDDLLLVTGLTPGGNADVDAANIPSGKTGRLLAADISSSIPLRADLQAVSGARVTRTVLYAPAGESRLWRSPFARAIELAGGGTNHFGASLTNLSPHLTADARITLYWDEVA